MNSILRKRFIGQRSEKKRIGEQGNVVADETPRLKPDYSGLNPEKPVLNQARILVPLQRGLSLFQTHDKKKRLPFTAAFSF
jgi:hypothetical protein